ncbi:unnamed protein product [Rotaria sp. Silwood2]|nr:unnamed protein product [Rotaria sp. Silwood2]
MVDYLWSFDCGDTREDLTGLYNATAVNGAVTISPDYSGQGKTLYLDRKQNQYIILPRSLNLTLNTSFTVTSWLLIAGYMTKTILSDCNSFNPICITFLITETTMNIDISNWDNATIIQTAFVSFQNYGCQACWMHVAFSFNHQTGSTIFYFNGMQIGEKYLNMTVATLSQPNKAKATYIGLNAVTNAQPFYGLIDQLSVLYAVKNASVILYEATTVCHYTFDSEDINDGWGPNNIRARSQHVYRLWSNNKSSLLFNDSDSYFQSSGFTLMDSSDYEYSISFWLRLVKYISWEAFSSTTKNKAMALLYDGNTIFHIHVPTNPDGCIADISSLSQFPEEEVLLDAQTFLMVKKVEQDQILNKYIIHLQVSDFKFRGQQHKQDNSSVRDTFISSTDNPSDDGEIHEEI